MNKQLKLLVQLQAIENRKRRLLQEREEAPKRKLQKEKEFQAFEAEVVMKKAELENLRKLHNQLEKDVTALEGKYKRIRQKEGEVKTNREYKALLKEQEEIRQEIVEKEDRLLECMEGIETLSVEVKALEKELQERKRELQRELEIIDQKVKNIELRVVELNVIQQNIKKELDPQILRKCEFLFMRHGGVAVAPVEQGVCKVCYMSIPPQLFIELQKDQDLINCPHCHRYIYWPGHEEYTVAAEKVLEVCATS